MDQKTRLAIGVDLGGTKIDFGLVDETGQIHDHARIPTPVEKGYEGIVDLIIENVVKLQKKASHPILGIGIGVAGQIDRDTGEVIFAPNLKWHHVPLRVKLEAVLKLPVRIINDARALTLGEWKYGAGIGLQDILCLFIGTGIGGGIVSGGSLLCGATNAFGEVGHMTIDFRGPDCTCGKKGCFEAYCGGWGIAARAKDLIGLGDSTEILELAGGDLKNVTAFHVIQAYREKDSSAKKVIDQMT
jgi:glucokinase